MIPLAVFDLDHTALSIDSFQMLLLDRIDLRLVGLAALRRMRILDRSSFAEKAHRLVADKLSDAAFVGGTIERMSCHIDPEIAALIQARRNAGDYVLLLSASPDSYVAPLAQHLGCNGGAGSRWENGRYVHLHGAKKLDFLNERFPREYYLWRFGVADSEGDRIWMAQFSEQRWVRRTGRRWSIR